MYQLIPVTHPCLDTKQPLLLLQSDHGEKYFFGRIGEGTQRACNESKIKFGKLNGIFLTGEMDYSCIGGLPGLILTASDQGKKNVSIFYGSSILDYVVSTWRYFVFRFGLDLKVFTLKDSECFADKTVSVKSIVIKKAGDGCADSGSYEKFTKGLKSIIARMFPEVSPTDEQDPSSNPTLNVDIPPQAMGPRDLTSSYEISFPSIRGKFNANEAQRLQIPKGKLYAELARGNSITLEDGTVINPEQVLSATRTYGKVLVLDIPSNAYISKFCDRFKDYPLEQLSAVYYFLGDDVTITNDLFNFMDIFHGDHIQHFVSHSKISPNSLAYENAATATLKLKALQNDNYNVPITDRVYSKEFFECFSKDLPEGTSVVQQQEDSPVSKLNNDNVHIFEKMKGIALEPFVSGKEVMPISETQLATAKPSSTIDELYNNHVVPLEIDGASLESIVHEQLHINNFDNDSKDSEIEIISLGTGSALPSKYRNVISTLIKIPFVESNGNITKRTIILDAGENTLGTIHRTIPDTDIPKLFRNLRMIYLSHLHADHHLGIASLIKEWYKFNENTNERLYVITPWQYNIFLQEWFALEDPKILSRIEYISCEHLKYGDDLRLQTKPLSIKEEITSVDQKPTVVELDNASGNRDQSTIKKMMNDLRIMSFRTCPAIHCNWAYSNSITFFLGAKSKQVFKVSYSGDTRPNFNLFAKGIGKNSDLLIHEATLENELKAEAIKKKHSTINEAIKISNVMNARKLLLTHFSQRYPKVPNTKNSIVSKAKEVCFAFDGMIVTYNDLGKQQDKVDLLSRIFIEEEKDAENEEVKD
ncbi:Ribonuclease Z [Kluyveromyces marxianus]